MNGLPKRRWNGKPGGTKSAQSPDRKMARNREPSKSIFRLSPYLYLDGSEGFGSPVSRRSHEPREDQVDPSQWKKLPRVFHTDHLPLDAPAGRYLVGCVMPEGGWAAFSNIRPEFSVRLRADDSFSYGFNGELNSNLQIVRGLSRPKR